MSILREKTLFKQFTSGKEYLEKEFGRNDDGTIKFNNYGRRIVVAIDGKRDLGRGIMISRHADTKFEVDPLDPHQSPNCSDSDIKIKSFTEFGTYTTLDKAISFKEYSKQKITLIIDDPAGHSFVENLHHPFPDPKMEIRHYGRNKYQNEALGLEHCNLTEIEDDLPTDGNFDIQGEVMTFDERCASCSQYIMCKMKLVLVPFFKEITLMSIACDWCGFRSNEVKPGGGIEPKGRKHILKVQTKEDLARDILKSDMASIQIPELEWDIGMGCLAGKFTTLEGILKDLKTNLIDKNPFNIGDNLDDNEKKKYETFKENVVKILNLEMDATFILDDPSGNSYILSLEAPAPDPQLEEIEYERSWEQNEELGLNDINTEDYQS